MGNNLVSIHAEDIRAVGNRVIVSDMHFGEQKTRGGIIIRDDDGTSRGIYPRWGKVFRKGPKNSEPYEEGQWVLVEHGRWTRGLSITIGDVERTLRMVEAESILGYSENQPEDAIIGTEYNDGPADIRPEEFQR
jgi:co-chaperonin GroES (HSP10)|tara:strand:- start:464 stop:865 length:402 start_codon:yes stop_codon:yes gene_type:complete